MPVDGVSDDRCDDYDRHDTIRNWIEARKGQPARVKAQRRRWGLLRVDFGKPEDTLEKISWDEFFKIFDDENLAFLHQDMTDGRATQPLLVNSLTGTDPKTDIGGGSGKEH